MQFILLGGNSSLNKSWIEQVSKTLNDSFSVCEVFYYRHWETGESLIDFSYEEAQLVKKCEGLTDFVIFAKSAGTLVVASAVQKGLISPKMCVFVGTPIPWGISNGFDVDAFFKNFNIPTLFIQQKGDPAMSFDDLKNYLEKMNVHNHTLQEIPGNSHHYADLEVLRQNIIKFAFNS